MNNIYCEPGPNNNLPQKTLPQKTEVLLSEPPLYLKTLQPAVSSQEKILSANWSNNISKVSSI